VDQPRGRFDKRPIRQPRERIEEEKTLRPATRRQTASGPPPINREITISEGITVKELSEKLDVKANLHHQEAGGSRHLRHHQPDLDETGHRIARDSALPPPP
jgi:hypothetical protein